MKNNSYLCSLGCWWKLKLPIFPARTTTRRPAPSLPHNCFTTLQPVSPCARYLTGCGAAPTPGSRQRLGLDDLEQHAPVRVPDHHQRNKLLPAPIGPRRLVRLQAACAVSARPAFCHTQACIVFSVRYPQSSSVTFSSCLSSLISGSHY